LLAPTLELKVSAQASHPCWTAVLVVAGVLNVLHIHGIKKTAPRVKGVVAFHNGFAAIVEPAIAKQKALTAVLQVVLMVALDGV
jgi:hypothetical protein